MSLATTVRDSSFTQIVWGHLNGDLVASQDANVMFSHLAGYVSSNNMSIFEFYSEHGVGECVYDYTLHLDGFFFSH
jgi:hypothetical protein